MAAAAQDAPAAPPAAEWPAVLFTPYFQAKVKGARVLAVGAGGIGCELLKTLVLSGFENIEVIDLDTIETSNLNRQFLFRRSHVGQSKARVAAEVVQAFAPAAHITAFQANVKEARFGLDYVRGFDLVLNGLDNMDARRHVNRLCSAAGVPLVESGTAGYVGQVSVHIKGVTECYECNPLASTQKTYPICTLRNTPDKPIHCVVWAKELLFPRLFGKVEVSDLDEQSAAPTPTAALEPAANGNGAAAAAAAANGDSHDPAAASNGNGHADAAAQTAQEKAAAAAAAAEAEAAEAASFFKLQDGEQPLAYAVRVFERVYGHDIHKVLSMEELWKTRTPPSALQLQQLLPDLQQQQQPAGDSSAAAAVAAAASSSSSSVARALGLKDQGVWPVADSARVFLAAVVKFLTQRADELGSTAFDKDDDLAVDFVTAASNLRSACYGITQQSAFDVKGMAGNIIHAIATTNAIVGGIIVSEALKILAGCPSAYRNSYIRTEPGWIGSKRTGRMAALISGEAPAGPKPGCLVCGKAQLHLSVNTQVMTLQQLVDKVLKSKLAVNAPNLMTVGGLMFSDCEEGLEEDEIDNNRRLAPMPLSQLPGGGLGHGVILEVDDQSQALAFEVIISHQGSFDEDKHPDGFILEGSAPEAQQEPDAAAADTADAAAASKAAAGTKRSREDDADDAAASADAAEGAAAAAAAEGAQQPSAKRQKQQQPEPQAGDDGDAVAAASAEVVDLISSDEEEGDMAEGMMGVAGPGGEADDDAIVISD